ncbi:nuclear transport factor 2 family protein [Mesorhizobium sp. CN2-181]|uniref:nuclear transport factor 2 family protein n=1 Tax=Mesorhizobium yinganensis TaxID=3157707 RepID=UPI0032B7E26E
MSDSKNLTNLKAAYAAWGKSKLTANVSQLEALMAENFRIASVEQATPGLEFAMGRMEKSASVAYLNGIFDEWEMVHFTPETYVEQGDKIAMFGKCAYKHKITGRKAECRISNLWEFKDGKAVSMIDLFDSAKAVAAATP